MVVPAGGGHTGQKVHVILLPPFGTISFVQPYQGQTALNNTAPGITRLHKPLHHDKVVIYGGAGER